MFASLAYADNNIFIFDDNDRKITQSFDQYFANNPNNKEVIWLPEINGKSRYSISIPKDAFLTSKKYLDSSDLYYLSKKIDNGLKFQPKRLSSFDISVLKNNYKAIFNQRYLSNVNAGLFFEKKENSFGMIFNKDFIMLNDTFGNFGFEQAKDKYTIFNAKFVKLTKNENSEIHANVSHEHKSKNLNAKIGHTWFEIGNQFDFTVNIIQHNEKISSDIFASFYKENVKFQLGINHIRNNSNSGIFFNIRVENLIDKKYFTPNVSISSKNDIFSDKNLSLKKYRKQSLDLLWRDKIKF